MANKYSAKRKLIASMLVLCLCFSMLVGTTLAWFTDEVTSNNNVIQTGKLSVALYYADGEDPVPQDKEWTKVTDQAIFTKTNWEPGFIEAKHLRIANEGTLALKYQMRIIPNGEAGKLADVIDVYYFDEAKQLTRDDFTATNKLGTLTEVLDASYANAIYKKVAGNLEAGKAKNVTFAFKMQESADNEYQELTIGAGFSIQIIATQVAAENDSFNNQYDVDAEFPVITTPEYTLPTVEHKPFNLGISDVSVMGTAALAAELAANGITDLSFKASTPVVKDGVVTIKGAGLYDQNGVEIDLSANTEAMTVKVFVGKDYAAKNVSVAHDGEVVALATVDENGFVTYTATHFCDITIQLDTEIGAGSVIIDGEVVEDLDKVEADLTTIVDMVVGSHAYKVSLGMAKSWHEFENVAGKIEADIYIPEDLYAFSMMYKNGDLAETGSHSDLTLINDLDFKGKNYEPIGRFFTNIHGNGKKISNLNDSLLGCVYDCQIYDLTLENVNVSASAAGIIAKELAGDIFIENVVIAGKNSVSYVSDSKTNWPEEGYGIGALCGVSLVAYTGQGKVDVTIEGSVELNYGENAIFYNNTNLENLGISKEFGLNVYKANQNVTVKGAENITTNGNCYMLIADGVGLSADKKTYAILNLEGFVWFADYVNAGNTMSGKTVVLLENIDLDNMEWTPIGTGAGFCGVFDGNGLTVSNLKITGDRCDVGLFGNTYGGEIKNLTVNNASVEGYLDVGVVAGNPYTAKYTNITVTGHVEVNGFAYVGGVGGKNVYADWTYIKVDVDETSYVNAVSEGYRTYVGGVIGFMGEGSHVVSNVVSNIDVIGDVCDIGGITGIAHYGNKFENIVCTGDVTGTLFDPEWPEDADEIGGIAGVWHNQTGYTVTFNNCEFKGTITPADASVDVSDNTIVGRPYNTTGKGVLIIDGQYTDVETNIDYYVQEDGSVVLDDAAAFTGTDLVIPEGVTVLGNKSVYQHSTVKNVTFPSTLTTIGYSVFNGSKIESVVIPGNVTLNERPNGNANTFADCTSLTSLTLEEGLKSLPKSCFAGCTALTSVVIPSSMESLSRRAFYDCIVLETVYLLSEDCEIGDSVFGANQKSKPMTIYVVNEAMKAAVEATLDDNNQNIVTVKVMNHVTNSEELIAAINAAQDGDTIYLEAGNYSVEFTNHTSFNVDNLTFVASNGANLAINSTEVNYGRIQGDNVKFVNFNFVGSEGNCVGATGTVTYENCTFPGKLECANTAGKDTIAINSTINFFHTSVDMHTGNAYLENCTIATAEYSGFADTTVYFENCTIDTLVPWNVNTVLTNCTVESFDKSRMTSASLIIDGDVYITPSNLDAITFASNTKYRLTGDFGGNNVNLVMLIGVENVVFDGADASNINELIIKQNGTIIDNANNVVGERSGKVTVQKFKVLSQINVFACKTEVVVQNNVAEALMIHAGNCDVKVINNVIDANFESHPTYSNATTTWNTNDYGIALNIFDYNLWFEGNTVTNAISHAVGINGWEGTFDIGEANVIESFKNNNITVNSTVKTKRVAFKIWDDETYASNDADTETVNSAAQGLINTILDADNNNTLTVIDTAGKGHTKFGIYNVNTNN